VHVTAEPLSLAEELALLLAGEPSVVQDPYPLHRRLREESPVHWADASTVIVSPHRLAKGVLHERRRFAAVEDRAPIPAGRLRLLTDSDLAVYSGYRDFERLLIDHTNGAMHRRIRDAAQGAFTPRRIAQLRASVLALVEELLDRLVERGPRADFIDFAYHLPLLVIMDMIDAPRTDAEMLKGWGDAIVKVTGESPLRPETVRETDASFRQFYGYIQELIGRQRRRRTRAPLVEGLLEASRTRQVSDEELVALYMIIFNGGHTTTTHLLGNGLYALLSHPEQWALLRSEPTLIDTAVEELLRFDPAVQFVRRLTTDEQEIGGVRIPAGTHVLVNTAAANRDPDSFTKPDELDLRRQPNDHIGFGYGTHFCLGAGVARLEAQAAFAALARRFPDLELAIEPRDRTFDTYFIIRGLHTLPVDLGTPAAASHPRM
jgi:cytochrome P450